MTVRQSLPKPMIGKSNRRPGSGVITAMSELASGDLYTILMEVLIAISTLLILDVTIFKDD